MPEVYEFLEAERIRLNTRSGCRPTRFCRAGSAICSRAQSDDLRTMTARFYANFSYQAGTAPEGYRQGRVASRELYPRVGFIATNMSRPTERVVAFYNKRGTCEQWSGRDCRAERSPPTRCGSSFMRSPTMPDGPWMFRRAVLSTAPARAITERAPQNPRHPAGSHPDQQCLFSSMT
jgi:hypothetical protein